MRPALLERVLAAGPALELGDWTLGRAALGRMLSEVAAGRRQVLECGSGVSTVLLARVLAGRHRRLGRLRRGAGFVLALEHDPEWATRVRGLLAAERLGGRARVLDAPLEPHALATGGCDWYSERAVAALPRGFDLLLVDGPPAGLCESGAIRAPALGRLAPLLAPGATIVLDDAQRPSERLALARWREQHRFEPDLVADGEKSFAVGMYVPQTKPGAST